MKMYDEVKINAIRVGNETFRKARISGIRYACVISWYALGSIQTRCAYFDDINEYDAWVYPICEKLEYLGFSYVTVVNGFIRDDHSFEY